MKTIGLVTVLVLAVYPLMSQEKYPSRDSKEWNDLTVTQRWQAVNIPEIKLKRMSTNDLIDHCISFDFMWDIFNHRDYGTGLNVVINNHNGLRELLLRKDAAQLILNYYKGIDPGRITEMVKPAERGEFAGRIFFLELFLSHPGILTQFRGKEKELIQALLTSHDQCSGINTITGKEFYSDYSIETKVVAIGRAIAQYEGSKQSDPSIQFDLSKLTNEARTRILERARQL